MDALLSLGGNVGDRKANNDEAVRQIAALPGTEVTARSSYYRSAPDGPVAQDWFLNTAIAVTTTMTETELAAACRAIETSLGRDRAREVSWGPRTIDIDIVASGNGAGLMPARGTFDDRAFVIVPLAEIAPSVRVAGRTLAEHRATANTAGIATLDWPLP